MKKMRVGYMQNETPEKYKNGAHEIDLNERRFYACVVSVREKAPLLSEISEQDQGAG
jgi:hypothetical protein